MSRKYLVLVSLIILLLTVACSLTAAPTVSTPEVAQPTPVSEEPLFEELVLTYETNNCGIFLYGSQGFYDGPWDINWGDGTSEVNPLPSSHVYQNSGDYSITVWPHNNIEYGSTLDVYLSCVPEPTPTQIAPLAPATEATPEYVAEAGCEDAPMIRLRRNDEAIITTIDARLNVKPQPVRGDDMWVLGQFEPDTVVWVHDNYSVCQGGWRWWYISGEGRTGDNLNVWGYVEGWASEGDLHTYPHRWITTPWDIGGVIDEWPLPDHMLDD